MYKRQLYALLAFKIISGKILLFVNSIDECYRLKVREKCQLLVGLGCPRAFLRARERPWCVAVGGVCAVGAVRACDSCPPARSAAPLQLFLDYFSINACVLNSELPHNSRYGLVISCACLGKPCIREALRVSLRLSETRVMAVYLQMYYRTCSQVHSCRCNNLAGTTW